MREERDFEKERIGKIISINPIVVLNEAERMIRMYEERAYQNAINICNVSVYLCDDYGASLYAQVAKVLMALGMYKDGDNNV